MSRWFEKIRKKPPSSKEADPIGTPPSPAGPKANPASSPSRSASSQGAPPGVRRIGPRPAAAKRVSGSIGPLGRSLVPSTDPESPSPAAAAPEASAHKAVASGATQSPKAIYKQLMGSFYDAILISDNKGHLVDNNQRAVEFFGYSNEELWDMPVSRLITGLNEAVYERIRRAIGSDRFVLMNTRCVRLDGSKFPAEVGISMVALLGQDDFVFTVRNVERRLAQLKNLRSGQNAFMNAQAGCFVCDEQGGIVAANAAFFAMLRIPSNRPVTGTAIGELLPAVADVLARVAGGETVVFEARGAGDGETFRIQLAPNHQGAARIEGAVGSMLPLVGDPPASAEPGPTPG